MLDDQVIHFINYQELSPEDFLRDLPENQLLKQPEDKESLWVFWTLNEYADLVDLAPSIFGMEDDRESKNFYAEYTTWRVQDNIKFLLSELKLDTCPHVLVQYWAPETIGAQRFLTISNQPFGLRALNRGLCNYRIQSMNHKLCLDMNGVEQQGGACPSAVIIGGPPARVYLNQLPETNPDVRCYSKEEYPLLDTAVQNGIGAYFALPVIRRSTGQCFGVLELLLPKISHSDIEVFPELKRMLEVVDLKTFDEEEILQGKYTEGLQRAKDEIEEVLEMVCKSQDLLLGQAWVGLSYRICDIPPEGALDKSSINFDINCNKDMLIQKLVECRGNIYSNVCDVRPLRRNEGLVGKAVVSQKPCFCKDVSRLSEKEFPLSHYARLASLSSCFVICLTSNYTRNLKYVLELFFPDCSTGTRDYPSLLDMIIDTMKQNFRNFKIASGEQLGEQLSVQLIEDSINAELGSFEICKTVTWVPRTEVLEGEGDLTLLRLLDWQFSDEETAQNEKILVGKKRSRASTSSSVSKHRTNLISLNREDIVQQFGKSMKEASESLSISRSTLKRECRRHNIDRWPALQKNKASDSSSDLTYSDGRDRPNCVMVPQTIEITDASPLRPVVIKATYGDDIIRFDLSNSSGLADLRNEVITRLQLKDEHFVIKYKDGNADWILVACDKDLDDCISASRSLGGEVQMSVLPTKDQAPTQGSSPLTIKALYQDEIIKVQLSFSSKLTDLEEEIATSFGLSRGTFRLKYKDEEDDWISIVSDKHLQDCMLYSKSLGWTTIRISVHVITNRAHCV